MERFTLLTIAILLFASITKAQITKGSTFLGGSANLYSNKSTPSLNPDTETKNSGWGIRPQFGKAIKDNSVAGIFLNVGGYVNKQYLSQTKNSFYGGGVFLRNYFSVANRFYLFGDASLGINSTKDENLSGNGTTQFIAYKSKGIQTSLVVTPGLSFAASKRVHLEAALSNLLSLSFTSSKSKEYSTSGVLFKETKNRQFAGSANADGFNGLFVGIRFILP